VLDLRFSASFHLEVFRWVWNELVTNQPAWISNLSNLTSITTLGAIAAMYKKFNCEQRHCWRIGHHKVEGTTYRTCGKHTTAAVHETLQQKHAHKRPDQHAFLHRNR
jgi:hypothetical protein